MEKKAIKNKVIESLRETLGEKYFDLSRSGLLIVKKNNTTDFSIEVGINIDRRYEAYDCSATIILKWKRFSNLDKAFVKWYNNSYGTSAKSVNIFLGVSFNAIEGDFSAKSRGALWVASEEDLDVFISQCIDDLNGKVGRWIEQWYTWKSALIAMENNEDLCGSWRSISYFCLMTQVYGQEVACSWARGIDSDHWPELLAAQVEYLRSNVCRLS